MCGPPISQSAWIVRSRVKRSRYSSGIFPKSLGSMRSVNCAMTRLLLCPLPAELPVLRALYERSIDHLADVDFGDVGVALAENVDRVLELDDLGVEIGHRYLVHEEVIRAVQRGLVVELEVLPEHGWRAGLVGLHLQAPQ